MGSFDNNPPRAHPRVRGRCPSCHAESLFLGFNGYVTCGVMGCKDPGAAHDLLDAKYADVAPLLDEVGQLCDVADELEGAFPFDGNIKGLMLHVRAVRARLAALRAAREE